MYLPRSFTEAIGLKKGLPAIFVHTPKCGGSFIAEGIGNKRERHCFTRRHPLLKGHRTWMEYRDLFPKLGLDIHDFLTFSVVRNPWEWHVSFFHYIRQLKGRNQQKFALEHATLNQMTFADYLRWIDDPDSDKGEMEAATRNVSDWVVDETGTIVVDVVLRQETLEADFRRFISDFNLRLKVPQKRINASQHRDYRSYYGVSEIEIVARRHTRDMALFGYRFE